MYRLDSPLWRLLLPVIAGALGAVVYATSPLSHQAFCSPLTVPVIIAPDSPDSPEAR